MENNYRSGMPGIRITKDHRSCNCCYAQNYHALTDRADTRHVDVIYEVRIGNMVNALCPDCLRDLATHAVAELTMQPYAYTPVQMPKKEFCSIEYRDCNGKHYSVYGSPQDVYRWAMNEMTDEDEVLEVYRNNICLYSALQSDKVLTADDITGFFG